VTVGELRGILENGLIPDDIVISDYQDNVIDTVNLEISSDGSVTDIKFGMSEPK
jgi:hypothetical protein